MDSRVCLAALGLVFTVVLQTPRACADGICVSSITGNATEATSPFLFPNWKVAHVDTYDVWLCATSICTWDTTETFRGLTIQNYGTATSSDLNAVYFYILCGSGGSKVDYGPISMTYAGVWSGSPVWTWAGITPDVSGCAVSPAFSIPLRLYVDVDDCPTAGATVSLGVRSDPILNPAIPGGLTDEHTASNNCSAPAEPVINSNPKVITYVAKTKDRNTAAPGDTINYTIWYGRPGTTSLSSIHNPGNTLRVYSLERNRQPSS